jgi:hypothetical protein
MIGVSGAFFNRSWVMKYHGDWINEASSFEYYKKEEILSSLGHCITWICSRISSFRECSKLNWLHNANWKPSATNHSIVKISLLPWEGMLIPLGIGQQLGYSNRGIKHKWNHIRPCWQIYELTYGRHPSFHYQHLGLIFDFGVRRRVSLSSSLLMTPSLHTPSFVSQFQLENAWKTEVWQMAMRPSLEIRQYFALWLKANKILKFFQECVKLYILHRNGQN